MQYTKEVGWEPLPGYRLIEPLGRGGFGEVWKCEVSGGLSKAIKIVCGRQNGFDPETSAQQEFAACERIKTIRHPFLLSLERVEFINGELILVTELADKNLEDRFWECRQSGLRGIPRSELLSYLLDAAEALDLLSCDFDLQHLDIKPSNLFIVGQHVKLADFGLVQSLEELRSAQRSSVPCGSTPLYSPPEMLQGKVSAHCDQYSLAIVYQYMLTGRFPFDGQNPQQLLQQHIFATPNLDSLSATDRPLVARALAKDPKQRFGSCLDFVRALVATEETSADEKMSGTVRILVPSSRDMTKTHAQSMDSSDPPSTQVIEGDLPQDEVRDVPTRLLPNNLQNTPSNTVVNSETPSRRKLVWSSLPDSFTKPRIAGYTTERCLLKSALGYLWSVRSVKGYPALAWHLRLQQSTTRVDWQEKWDALMELKHPALPKLRRPPSSEIDVVVVDSADPLLWKRYQTCLAQGRPGMAREELVGYLARAAVALDELALATNLYHWNLNPYSLLLGNEQIAFTDFGFVSLLWRNAELPVRFINNRYAAPEMFHNKPAHSSDQYSLALIYVEMLTGVHPRPKITVRGKQAKMKIDLTLLPAHEQRAIRKALDHDPNNRFVNCQAFLEALGVRYRANSTSSEHSRLNPLVAVSQLGGHHTWPTRGKAVTVEEYIWDTLGADLRAVQFTCAKNCKYAELENRKFVVDVPVQLLRDRVQQKLTTVARLWNSRVSRPSLNSFVFRLPMKKSVWMPFLQKEQGIEVCLQLKPNVPGTQLFSGAVMSLTPYGSEEEATWQHWQNTGPELMARLCKALETDTDKRHHLRLPYSKHVYLYSLLTEKKVSHAIKGSTLDISIGGIRLILPQELPNRFVYVHWPRAAQQEPLAILAQIVWQKQTPDGHFEVGLSFIPQPISHADVLDLETQNNTTQFDSGKRGLAPFFSAPFSSTKNI